MSFPSPEVLYSRHKDAALEYEYALITDLPRDDASIAETRSNLDFIEWELELIPEVPEPIINKMLDYRQKFILKLKMDTKQIIINGAKTRLGIANKLASLALESEFDKWYDEAKTLMDSDIKNIQ